MKLIVGLGNIGSQYAQTRHNLGFMVTEQLRRELELSDWKSQRSTSLSRIAHDTPRTVILAQPQTMMNASGEAVIQLVHYYKIDPAEVWLVYDDVDLAFGKLRINHGAETGGGHNGVKSVMYRLGNSFWRFRVGIGNPHLAATPTDQFVLSAFEAGERERLPQVINQSTNIIIDSLRLEQPAEATHDLLK